MLQGLNAVLDFLQSTSKQFWHFYFRNFNQNQAAKQSPWNWSYPVLFLTQRCPTQNKNNCARSLNQGYLGKRGKGNHNIYSI